MVSVFHTHCRIFLYSLLHTHMSTLLSVQVFRIRCRIFLCLPFHIHTSMNLLVPVLVFHIQYRIFPYFWLHTHMSILLQMLQLQHLQASVQQTAVVPAVVRSDDSATSG